MNRSPKSGPAALLLSVVVALPAAVGCGGGEAVRPNVLLLTLDTTRADYLSCYGTGLGTTPAMDALAAEGTRFALALSASAVTPVSHATILTGQFPYTHGMRVLHADGGFRLRAERWYLPEAMKQAGYATAAVHSAFPVSDYFGFDRSFDVFESFGGALDDTEKREGGTAWDMEQLQRRGDETTDLALEVLAGLEEPFFLWLHYWDPHDNLRIPPEEFVAERDGGRMRSKDDRTYAIELEYLDGEIGRLFDHLRASGAWQNTLVALTADHGEGLEDGFARHAWKGHRMLYQEQIHVPLILRLPESLGNRAGSVVGELVRTADIVPTILDYADVPAGTSFDGKSLRALVEGTETEPRIAYADQINGYDRNAHMVEKRPDAAFLYTVAEGDWKLTYRPHMPEASELFNLSKDPGEVHNLYDKRPREARRLLRELARRRPWVTAPFPPDAEAEDAGDVQGALGALGYAAGVVAEVAWTWTCVEHGDHRLETAQRCPDCDELLVPIQTGQ